MNRPTRLLLVFALATMCAGALVPAHAQAPHRPRGVHYLYLIRHGDYDYDSTVTDDAKGNGLNALGHEQARLVGQRLAGLHVPLHALVTSNYLRALQTADDMGPILGLKPVVDTLIHECTPHFETRPEYRPLNREAEALACEDNLNAAFAKYFVPTPEADTYDVLVCHGNVIRWLTCKVLGVDVLNWRRLTIGNCSVTAFAVQADGRITLAAYSDTGHIPAGKQTWTGRGAGWGPPPAPRTMK
jgi:serine/threonine-protein phosphatase PGAM5